MEEYRYINDELWCEQVNLRDVVAAHRTPLYVYSRSSIVDHTRHIEAALRGVDHLSCYAVKANANAEILRIIAAEGVGADVGSAGELRRALGAGFEPRKITFSGVGKGDDEIEEALRAGIFALNVESEQELDVIDGIASRLGLTARVFFRINFDIPSGSHPYISTGQRQAKFGIEPGRAVELISKAHLMKAIEVVGIHSHVGSQIIEAAPLVAAAEALAALVEQLRQAGLQVRQLNFGGGFGVQYRDYVRHPSLPPEDDASESDLTTVKLLSAVMPVLRKTGCSILIQPGRSIVAHAGILLAKVVYRKVSGGKTFIIIDAGMNDLIRPSLYHSYHQIVPLKIASGESEVVDIVGPLCETGDFFALDRRIPVVCRNDALAVLCAGAYGYALSSNYNGRPRPAEVLVDRDQFRIISQRERFA